MAHMAPTTRRPRKTVEDYMALPDDVRAELIDGDLYVTPAPTSRHQGIVANLLLILGPFMRESGLGRVYVSPLDVHLPSRDVVQPDLILVRTANRSIVQDWIRGVPDLVIEVTSPSHPERDRIVKRNLYARNGVPAYWLVEPEERGIEVLRLRDGVYGSEVYRTGSAVLRTDTLPGLEVPLEQVFE